MLPLSLLRTCQGHNIMVELKNGETYNGCLINCDNWMNVNLKNVIRTSKGSDKFAKIQSCYIRGNTIKYISVPDDIIDTVVEEEQTFRQYQPKEGTSTRGRGRGGYNNERGGGVGSGGRGSGSDRGGRGGYSSDRGGRGGYSGERGGRGGRGGGRGNPIQNNTRPN